jgi:hypothetical protein
MTTLDNSQQGRFYFLALTFLPLRQGKKLAFLNLVGFQEIELVVVVNYFNFYAQFC